MKRLFKFMHFFISGKQQHCCLDCYKETICDLSSPMLLQEAIDIGMVDGTNAWLSTKFPAYDFASYNSDTCRRNRVRRLLAAAFNHENPIEKPGKLKLIFPS